MMTEPETTPTSNPMPASPPSGQPQPPAGTSPGVRLVALVNGEPEVNEPTSSSGFGLVDASTATPAGVTQDATINYTGPELVPPPPPDPASILAAPSAAVVAVGTSIEHNGPALVPPPPPDPASILAAPGIGAQVRATISEPIIALSNVSVQYTNGVKALSDIDLMIPHGDFVFLVGATGAGKSTILKLLYMDARATSGRVWVNGRDLTTAKSSDTPYVRRRMGIILQDFGLLPRRTVWENVAFACHVIGQSRRETRKRLPEVLERVGMLHRADAYPNELSGGEQQRVAIARALINDPPLLVADEPTGSLDPKTGAEIMDLLAETAARGTTVVVATHDKSAVDRLQKRVVALSGGRIIRDDAVGSYGVDDLEETT